MDPSGALAPVLSRLVPDLRSFLHLLDQENLSNIAQARKKSLWELLGQIPPPQSAVSAEDAEYMVMSCPAPSEPLPAGDWPAGPEEEPDQTRVPEAASAFLPFPGQRAGSGEDEEDTYEEAEPYVGPAPTGGADGSVYESYGEEEEGEEPVTDRAHYLRPPAQWRLSAYLWRRRWLQWTKEWFLIQKDSLLCYRCARDLLPQLELNLRGCRLALKSRSDRKIPQQLKLSLRGPPARVLVLGFGSSQQAQEWTRVLQELSADPDSDSSCSRVLQELSADPDSDSTSSRSGSVQSDSSHSGPDCPEDPDVLNVLMSCQWQSLRCQVEPGRLSMYAAEAGEEEEEPGRAQYSVQLRGCHVAAGPANERPYRITLSALGDTVAVLEAASAQQMRRWLRHLQDGAGHDPELQNQDPPVYSNTCQGSGPARSTSDGAAYSNAFLAGGGGAQVRRSVQKPSGRTDVQRAGSEVNLSAGKRAWFRQSLSVCSERAQSVLLSPLLRRTSSLLEPGSVTQKRRVWESRAAAGP